MSAPLKSRFTRFIDAIRPTEGQRNLARTELIFLEVKLREYIQDDHPFQFVKALRPPRAPA